MRKELSQKCKNRIVFGAWILISLQAMSLIGIAINKEGYNPSIRTLLRQPTSATIGRAFGSLVGINILPIVALTSGLTLWRHGKNEKSKTIIITSFVTIILGSLLIF